MDQDIFLITSIIFTSPYYMGTFSPEVRYLQTLETINSIKKYNGNSTRIVLIESSKNSLKEEWLKTMIDTGIYVVILNNPFIDNKQDGDIFSTISGLQYIKENLDVCNVSRSIYKISGRYLLNEKFKGSKDKNNFWFKKNAPSGWTDHNVFDSFLWGIPSKKIDDTVNILKTFN